MNGWNFIKAYDKYCNYPDNVPAPILRRSFDVDFEPKSTEIRICTPGFYKLYINGHNITRGKLAPFVSNPDHLVYYDTYSLTQYVKRGKNAIAVVLGNGFANQDFQYKQYNIAPHRAPLSVALCLKATSDEKVFVLTSDENFKVHPSPILYDMYHLGTVYDAREEVDGFSLPEFDDTLWNSAQKALLPKGKITPSTALPVRVRKELKAQTITQQEGIYYFYDNEGNPFEETYVKEGWCYDFGATGAGVCRLRIKGKRGQKITLRHCETLKDGNFCMNSIHTVNDFSPSYFTRFQADTYILRGGEEEIYIPSFTYHGFRYVLVEGITKEQANGDLLTFLVLNTDAPKLSSFSCSDNILNKIYNMAIEADYSNFVHIITDCPHREKCGWTGDISMSAHQFALSFDCFDNLRMWMEAARCCQTKEGVLPGVIPTSGWGYAWGNGPVWDSAIVNVPYYLYKYYGREDIIEENTDMIIRYLRYIAGRRDEKGLIAIGLGDWCQPGRRDSQPDSPLVFTDSSQIFETALRSAFLFDKTGRTAEKEYALNLAREMKSAICENLIDFDTMTVAGNCQTSQAVAIRLGLFEENQKDMAFAKLLEFIQRDNYTINCGMIGLRNIFHVLCDGGYMDLALDMITKENAPSYRDMIDRGGTALFESLSPNGFQQSCNHHFYGDVINLFISKLCGIQINPDMDDIYKVNIIPAISQKLTEASAYRVQGDSFVSVKWKKENDKVRFTSEVRGKFHGKIYLPGICANLKKGVNEFVFGRIDI